MGGDEPLLGKDHSRSVVLESFEEIPQEQAVCEPGHHGEKGNHRWGSISNVISSILEAPRPISKDSAATDPALESAKTELNIVNWDPKSQRIKRQGIKRPYLEEEKAKVTYNRGFVCDKHHRQKKKV